MGGVDLILTIGAILAILPPMVSFIFLGRALLSISIAMNKYELK